MQVQILYGSSVTSKEQLHALLAERLTFPSYYGHNLDALHDCLCELSQPTQLIICERDILCDNLGSYGSQFLRVLQDSADENELLRIEYR